MLRGLRCKYVPALQEPLERTLCGISKEDCVTGFSQHYFRNVAEWVLKPLPDKKNIGDTRALALFITALLSKGSVAPGAL